MPTHYTYRYSRERTETTTAFCSICKVRWAVIESQSLWDTAAACPQHEHAHRVLWKPLGDWIDRHAIDDGTISPMQQAQDALQKGDMDTYQYMTNPRFVGKKLERLYDEAPPTRRRHHQRNVSIDPQGRGTPTESIAYAMGFTTDQSKYSGESIEEKRARGIQAHASTLVPVLESDPTTTLPCTSCGRLSTHRLSGVQEGAHAYYCFPCGVTALSYALNEPHQGVIDVL